MKDFSELLTGTLSIVDTDLERVRESGSSDDDLNYLYTMRDEINARIKKARKA